MSWEYKRPRRGRRSRKAQAVSPGRVRPRPSSGTEQALRKKIQSFTYQERFGSDVKQAMGAYFGEEMVRSGTLVVDEDEIPGFQEWYINDFVTGEGARIIDLFAGEKRPLSEAQAAADAGGLASVEPLPVVGSSVGNAR
jgi:hypothetical protein